jgi:hypothetical protein
MVLVLIAAAAAGCGSARKPEPAATTPPPRGGSAGRAVVVGATPSTTTPATTGDASARDSTSAPTARQAVERFAKAYINWTYRTIATDRERLARTATGDAATSLARSAAQSRGDYELQTGKVANSGDVVAVTQRQGGTDGSWVVVTRERMAAAGTYDGLPAGYHVTIATVEDVGDGWAVSHWEPQS